MGEELYTSCIKINGVPIIPPLLSEDVREEMNYYKHLAIAVEERIKYLQQLKHSKRLKHSVNSQEIFQTETEESTELSKVVDETSPNEVKISKTSSEEDCHCQIKANLNDSPSSDAVTTSTDLNQYLNESTTSTKTTTGETTPEIWKPQVPKTLNIIPITLSQNSLQNDDNINDELSKSNDDTPKMVRQGSYVLDTPSPILLAHMQTGSKIGEYLPSSAKGSRRKEWNLAQVRTSWEKSNENKSVCSSDSNRSTPKNRPRRNSASNVQTHKINKALLSKTKGSFGTVKRSAYSVDSINTMLFKDVASKSSSGSNTPVNGIKKEKESLSILEMTDQLTSPLASKSMKINRWNNNDHQLNLNHVLANDNVNCTTSPEKVVILFQEIQDLQKKQMRELLEKQRREQLKMQEEFKRQQAELLSQIKKAFPETTLTFEGDLSSLAEKLDNRIRCDDENNVERCPLNYVCSLYSELGRDGNDNFDSRMTRSLDSERTLRKDYFDFYHDHQIETSSNVSHNSDNICDDKVSSVNRQLFTHAPIFNHSLYNHKHHRAATVINAYARGYLVRRLMKTEQVIALKNTYKEALHCLLKLHVDAPLNLPELNFHRRLQLQLDAASTNIVDLFAQNVVKKMEIIAHDRYLKKSRSGRPSSARSYSFATQRTLARKKMKEMGECHAPLCTTKPSNSIRARCQTWTSNSKEKRPVNVINQGIKRSTSAGAVRKPWR